MDKTAEQSHRDDEWLVKQLRAWPERVDMGKTTSITYLMQSAADEIDRLAALSARPADDYVLVRAAALDWLFGEGPDDDGFHFGDEDAPRVKGAFWWRSKFRAMIAARPAVGEDVVERAYQRGVEDCLAAIRGTNADLMQSPGAAYRACVEAAHKVLDKAGMDALLACLDARAAIAAMGSADMGKGGEG